jgi:hypothetical protein
MSSWYNPLIKLGASLLGSSSGGAAGAGAGAAAAGYSLQGGDPSDLLKELDPRRKSGEPDIDPANFQLADQEKRSRELLQQADFAAGRGSPYIHGSGFRGAQSGLVQQLQARAAGQGPSVAQRQLQDALGRNVSTQQALLATGGGPGAARAASQQASALGGSLAGQSALLRANEITQAQGLLGQTLQGARGQDLQRQIAMSDAELKSRGLNDQQIARLRELELRNAQLGLQGTMGLEGARTTRRGQDLGVPGIGELIIGAGGSLLGAS